MSGRGRWPQLRERIVSCRACPRLVRWREEVARTRTKRFQDETYWGRPVPGFGDHNARLLLVGLAPAAHGANRTGRMFTGDRSGEWLYRALHRSGFASQSVSESTTDGLRLKDCYITAACRCAPPLNSPLPVERQRCRPFLQEEFRLLTRLRVVVALGRTGFDSARSILKERGDTPSAKPGFAHGSRVRYSSGIWLLASYHPSQQNTFTGTLTRRMFHGIFRTARALLDDA